MTTEYGAYDFQAGYIRQEYRHTLRISIRIDFPRQQWFRERASMLRYTYIACLVHIETRGTYTYHGVLNVNKIASSTDYCYSTSKFLENHQRIRTTDIIPFDLSTSVARTLPVSTNQDSSSSSSSSSCSGRIRFDSCSLYPQNEIGPSISSSVVL